MIPINIDGKDVKGCPFCGYRGQLQRVSKIKLPYRVVCSNLQCDVFPSTHRFQEIKEAIAAWNKRK